MKPRTRWITAPIADPNHDDQDPECRCEVCQYDTWERISLDRYNDRHGTTL